MTPTYVIPRHEQCHEVDGELMLPVCLMATIPAERFDDLLELCDGHGYLVAMKLEEMLVDALNAMPAVPVFAGRKEAASA